MLILAVVGRVDMDVGSVLWSCDERVSRDIDDLEHLYPYYPYIYTSWRGSMTHHTRAASSTSVSVSHFPSIGQCPSPPFPPFDLHILVRPSSTSLLLLTKSVSSSPRLIRRRTSRTYARR
jgi:hypothetical protein